MIDDADHRTIDDAMVSGVIDDDVRRAWRRIRGRSVTPLAVAQMEHLARDARSEDATKRTRLEEPDR